MSLKLMKLTILLIGMCGSLLLAEEPKLNIESKAPKTETLAPVIAAEIELLYWRYQNQARISAERAKVDAEALARAAQNIIAICGEKYQPVESFDAKGNSLQRFKCEPKPAPKASPAPPVDNKPKTP